MISPNALTPTATYMLALSLNGPTTFSDLRRELALFAAEDLRPSAVSTLLADLVADGLLAYTDDGRLAVTLAGRAVVGSAQGPTAGR